MKVVFRVDASSEIGTGHIMRCLTLAQLLSESGVEIVFISRRHKSNLNHIVTEKCYELYELPCYEIDDENAATNSYLNWLGTTWEQDARQVNGILTGFKPKPDLLIVDHYSLDHKWETKVRPNCKQLMVIDDLANRKHNCNFLLDQTVGRTESDYQTLVSANTSLLLGTNYALLRPEFMYWRDYSIQRREVPVLKNILITFGGVDADNYTSMVIQALNQCSIKGTIAVTVILGEHAPHINIVRDAVNTVSFETTILTNVTNMAEVMAKSDLCIGAAGATSWERCCLALPSFMIVIANNQENIAESVSRKRSAILLKLPWKENLLNEIEKLDALQMKELSHNSSNLVDGMGAERVVERIIRL